jgi:hypothetical protein
MARTKEPATGVDRVATHHHGCRSSICFRQPTASEPRDEIHPVLDTPLEDRKSPLSLFGAA